jgi:sulfoxide reductase heme-binding subunit YedZ
MATAIRLPACITGWTCEKITEKAFRFRSNMKDLSRHINMRWLKPPIFLACLAPLAHLVWLAFRDELSANPTEFIRNSLGTWTLVFLCITLAITPSRRLLGQNWLIRFRRMLGLFAFFYASLHLITYVVFDTGFDSSAILKDIYKRPFITAGFTAFVLLIPLAVTSTSGMIRRLGGRRWNMLHRLIYISVIAGVIHYYWLVKSDETVPLRFAAVVSVLLAYRVIHYALQRRRQAAEAAKKSARESVYSA